MEQKVKRAAVLAILHRGCGRIFVAWKEIKNKIIDK